MKMELKRRVSTQFKKDFKRYRNDDLLLGEFEKVVKCLANGIKLEDKYRDHALKGNYAGSRECHIKPDILLVYKIDNNELELLLLRLGSHSELF